MVCMCMISALGLTVGSGGLCCGAGITTAKRRIRKRGIVWSSVVWSGWFRVFFPELISILNRAGLWTCNIRPLIATSSSIPGLDDQRVFDLVFFFGRF